MANEHVVDAHALVWFLEGLDISLRLIALKEMHDRQIVATALHLALSGGSFSLSRLDACGQTDSPAV